MPEPDGPMTQTTLRAVDREVDPSQHVSRVEPLVQALDQDHGFAFHGAACVPSFMKRGRTGVPAPAGKRDTLDDQPIEQGDRDIGLDHGEGLVDHLRRVLRQLGDRDDRQQSRFLDQDNHLIGGWRDDQRQHLRDLDAGDDHRGAGFRACARLRSARAGWTGTRP